MYYTYLARRNTFFAWVGIQTALASFVASQYMKPRSRSQNSSLTHVYQNAQAIPATH